MNEDKNAFARVDTDELEWVASPSAGVWRKRCYLDGDKEKGAVTSVVRYDAGSAFPTHQHPQGEELLVLDGVFTDASGSYPAGTFILNPPGSSHAPASEPGCDLFVRLRQYSGRETVRANLNDDESWTALQSGVGALPLWAGPDVEYRMIRIAPGVALDAVNIPFGQEIFVVTGSFSDEHGTHDRRTWLRYPADSSHTPRTDEGCSLLVRKLLRTPGAS